MADGGRGASKWKDFVCASAWRVTESITKWVTKYSSKFDHMEESFSNLLEAKHNYFGIGANLRYKIMYEVSSYFIASVEVGVNYQYGIAKEKSGTETLRFNVKDVWNLVTGCPITSV